MSFSDHTVLLVDDNLDLQESMSFDFRRKGFKVLFANNGTDALATLKKEKISLVISDMHMPEGNGSWLLAEMKALLAEPPPLIFVTGSFDAREMEKRHPQVKVLPKLFDRKELMSTALAAIGLS